VTPEHAAARNLHLRDPHFGASRYSDES